MLERIDSTLRHKEIQEQIKKYILEGSLKPGDRLPSENAIASQLGVSRNAVREALKALEALGIIEVRVGLGTYVKEFSLEDLLTNFVYSFLFDGGAVEELYEIRKQLELGFIKQAVRNVTDEDVAEMREILKRMQDKTEQGVPWPEEDMALHRVIYRGIDNQSLLKLLDIFGAVYKSAPFLSTYTRDEMKLNLRKHIDLVDAIASRDEEKSWVCLDEQFLEVRKFSLLRSGDEDTEAD